MSDRSDFFAAFYSLTQGNLISILISRPPEGHGPGG